MPGSTGRSKVLPPLVDYSPSDTSQFFDKCKEWRSSPFERSTLASAIDRKCIVYSAGGFKLRGRRRLQVQIGARNCIRSTRETLPRPWIALPSEAIRDECFENVKLHRARFRDAHKIEHSEIDSCWRPSEPSRPGGFSGLHPWPAAALRRTEAGCSMKIIFVCEKHTFSISNVSSTRLQY